MFIWSNVSSIVHMAVFMNVFLGSLISMFTFCQCVFQKNFSPKYTFENTFQVHTLFAEVWIQSDIACIASVSVWFRGKERPRKGIFGFGHARNETRAPLFYLRHFRAVFDYRSSFFAPKPHGNACYAGYKQLRDTFLSHIPWLRYTDQSCLSGLSDFLDGCHS